MPWTVDRPRLVAKDADDVVVEVGFSHNGRPAGVLQLALHVGTVTVVWNATQAPGVVDGITAWYRGPEA